MSSVKRRKLSPSEDHDESHDDEHNESPESETVEESVAEAAPKTFKELVCENHIFLSL